MNPRQVSIHDYSYDLPDEKIARFPLPARDMSKLLIYQRRSITEDRYRNISQHLPEKTFLIFNDTKVVEARLLFQKDAGGIIEIFCLEPSDEYPDITSAMSKTEKVFWKCLIGGASKWKIGLILQKQIKTTTGVVRLQARYVEKKSNYFIIEFSWMAVSLTFAEVLHVFGVIPLPPYIKRQVELPDAERYQTVYARQDGSVAAPTAGLHFTENIFARLSARKIDHDFLTLHVGAGTFQPVKSKTLEQHEMHAEFIEVSASLIKKIIDHLDNGIIAVGTTSLRTIESLYWMGLKIIAQPDIQKELLAVNQWDAYELDQGAVDSKQSLTAILNWLQKQKLSQLISKTQLLIVPGYAFKIIKGIVTNFHQPQSTLLLLIAAVIGDDWKKVYEYALNNDFRFLSYGDGCLLLRDDG